MIRIWAGSIINIQENDFDRAKILDKYQSYKSNSKVKFVIQNQDKIISILDYRDILLKRVIKNNIVIKNNELFDQASEYFRRIENLYSGSPLGVINQTGKLELILEYYDNNNYIEKRPQYYYKWFYDQRTKLNYDRKQFNELFNKVSVVVFQTVEQYTIDIAKLLLSEKGLNIKLYFLDRRVQLFLKGEEVTVISGYNEIKEANSYILIVTGKENKKKNPSNKQRSTYQSVEIMMLLYEKEVAKQLNPHSDSPFIVYNDSLVINGIVDFMKFSIRNAVIAQHKGYIPVINISDNLAYSDGQGENAWEYYFNPISGYTVDQAYASENYIVSSRNYFIMAREQFEGYKKLNLPYFNIHKEIGPLVWKPEIEKYCESEVPEAFRQNKRILGVISRGTDYNKNAVIKRKGKDESHNASVEQLIDVTQQKMKAENYDYIYLATEDYYNYSQYIKAFGDKVIATKQERIDLIKNNQYSETIVARIPKEKWGFEYGLDYLVVLKCLAKCDALLSSMRCGAFTAAVGLNNNQYKDITVIRSNQ